jgi:hypothetical protein
VVETNSSNSAANNTLANRIRDSFSQVPLLAWFCGILVAVLLERFVGDPLTELLYSQKTSPYPRHLGILVADIYFANHHCPAALWSSIE